MKKIFICIAAVILISSISYAAGPVGRRACTDAEMAAGTSETPCVPTPKQVEDNDSGAGAGDVTKVGTPAQYEWGEWTGDGTLKGTAVTGSSVVCTDANGSPVACSNLADTDFSDADNISDGSTNAIITLTQETNLDTLTGSGAQAVGSGDSPTLTGTNITAVASVAASDGGDTGTYYIPMVSSATGTVAINTDSYNYFNASTNQLTVGIIAARASDPTLLLRDDDAPGTDKDVAWIKGAYVDGSDGSENSDFIIEIIEGGVENTEIIRYDESDGQWEIPSGKGLVIGATSVLLNAVEDTTPQAGGDFDLNGHNLTDATGRDDDDCTGDQGKFWWDSTDNQWEGCNANSGTPITLGSGAGTVDTSGTPVANDLARFTDADTIEGLSYAELWAVAGYLSAALAELDDENWTFTGDVDLSGANSVNFGPLTLEDGNATPASIGEFFYTTPITGLRNGALNWYDDGVRILVDIDTVEEGTLASGDDGKVVRYNWNSGSGYFDLTSAGAGDLLANGTIPLTANWDVGSYSITALTFTSDQATGTAPFTVASTTVVTNLNADTVDGEDASEIVTAARVGAASANLDDTDASIEWEDAAELQSDGSLSETGIALTSITIGTLLGETAVGSGIFLTDNNYVELDATADGMDDDEYNGVIIGGRNCGEGLTQWDTVRLANDADPWHQADANAAGEFPAHGLSVAACTDTNEARILVRGVVRNEGWTGLTPGGAVYLSETPGGVTQTAPSDSGDCVQIVGWALSDSEIYFDFSRPYGEVQ